MAFKGKAAKSTSGASMSKYDVEVEERLQALEAKAHEDCGAGGDGDRVAALEAKVNKIIEVLGHLTDLEV